jgi:hypothetical protein
MKYGIVVIREKKNQMTTELSIDQSAYSAAGKYVDRSWEYINRSQTHECGIGTEAAQFLFREHINGTFVAV